MCFELIKLSPFEFNAMFLLTRLTTEPQIQRNAIVQSDGISVFSMVLRFIPIAIGRPYQRQVSALFSENLLTQIAVPGNKISLF